MFHICKYARIFRFSETESSKVKQSTDLKRRDLKSESSGAEIDLEGKKYSNKDALEPGINIFQDSKELMETGDLTSEENNSKEQGKEAKKKSQNIKVKEDESLKTSDIISNDDIESITVSENKKVTHDNGQLSPETKTEDNKKSPLSETTGSSRQAIGMGIGHGGLVHPPTREDHNLEDITLHGAHIGDLPAQPLRHTGKVALVPAILHKTEHYDHETGHYRPTETHIEPVMNAHPVENWGGAAVHHNTGGPAELEHALGLMGGPHHEDVEGHHTYVTDHHGGEGTHHGDEGTHHEDHHETGEPHNLDQVNVHPYHDPPPAKKKPDIVKVEFVPEDVDVKASGNTKAGSKKGGSVRVQFIPGEQGSSANTKTPETREPATTSQGKSQSETASISTGALASKLKNKMEGREVGF